MAKLEDHPSVRAHRARGTQLPPQRPLRARELKQLCLEAGADDAGFVSLSRPALDGDRKGIIQMFSATRTVICLLVRMNVEPVRSPARSVANQEFHSSGDRLNDIARDIVRRLSEAGVRALNPPMAFPMETDRFPGKMWTVSLKTLAVAAGLGHMGIHRNVIHPQFGNFVLLGCVLIDAEVDEEGQPLASNPCLDCKLCVAACPVGAISPEGDFNFSSCYTHNYREFMGGFTDWVETVADSGSAQQYRARVSDSESVSMWQSLAYGPNYKAAYCMAVCPAGDDLIGPFLEDRPGFLREVVKPLQAKSETLYVLPDSDAEAYAHKRFPHKTTRRVGGVLRPTSIQGFIASMRHGFQPGRSQGLDAAYHFVFTGSQAAECTVTIREGKVTVESGLVGKAHLRVTADSLSWLKFLRKEMGVVRLLLTRRLRLKGNPRLLVAFGRCFP